MARAVILFSGGLDSMLAARVLQDQGLEVEAFNIRTLYPGCEIRAARVAARLGLRFTSVAVGDDYLELLRHPRFGHGRGLNPCIDCRVYMCRLARQRMIDSGADLVASGEVLGQRPKSQKRLDLEIIARHSGLEGRLLRPLSARRLPVTAVEADGLVDRDRLYGFCGAGRKGLIALARRLGLDPIPGPSSGCLLTRPEFSRRVAAVMARPAATRWDFELLSHGRHAELNPQTRVILGRNDLENRLLRRFAGRDDAPAAALLVPENFLGPSALLIGPELAEFVPAAAALVEQRIGDKAPADPRFRLWWSKAAGGGKISGLVWSRGGGELPPT